MNNTPAKSEDSSAWTAQSLGTKESLCFELRPSHLEALDAALQTVRARALETDAVTLADVPLPELAEDIRRLRAEISTGPGLLVVRGFPVDEYPLSDLETLFWIFGVQLGVPVSQSVMGDRLGHVTDVTDTDPNARAYRNNRELTLHTDLADLVSFLCVRKARSGGVSWFASALAVHEEMRRLRPDLLEVLYRGFPWFRSGENADDSDAVTPWRVPVLSKVDGLVSCRYVRDYIIEAQAHPGGSALTAKDIEALDYFDEIAHRDGVPIKFVLEPGEAVFINNLTVLHARTSFNTETIAEKKRLLLRLWMKMKPARPSVPELKIFDGVDEHGIPPQAGRLPSYAHRTPAQLMPKQST